MEGWANAGDESALHGIEIVQASGKTNGSALDLDFSLAECGFDESKSRLRELFNQVLVAFLTEIPVKKCMRPLPVLCANGLPVDLFKLFWVVRNIGGYDSVSAKNLWGFVGEECGLGLRAISAVKLIYFNYLNELDHWLTNGFRESSSEDGGSRVVKKLELLLQELEKEFTGLSSVERKGENEDVKFDKRGNEIDSGNSKRLLHCSSMRNIKEVCDHTERHVTDDGEKLKLGSSNDLVRSANQVIEKVVKEVHDFSKEHTSADGKFSCSQHESGVILSPNKVIEKAISEVHESAENISNVNEEGLGKEIRAEVLLSTNLDKVLDTRKRKRESSALSEMLKWLLHVAKHSDDLAIGRVPECSKWKYHGNQEFWIQALSARETLLIKRNADLNVEASLQQKKFRMHPSMYEDVLNHRTVDKSRCSQRLPLAKSQSCSCCNSDTQVLSPRKAETGNSSKEPPLESVEESVRNKQGDVSREEPSEKQVSVGPRYQAEVPEWTGVVTESDSKWLGTRMWPPADAKDESAIELDSIGKGRPVTCGCLFPGTTECIRFHIAEKRLQLKRELDLLFYKWKFDHMGEEVSLSWTTDEEKKFKAMIRSNTESTNNLWSNALKVFPSKTREQLVSYYFNVFLVQRRNYQNRVTPKDIDSDDDEKEFGSVGDSFGYKAIYVPDSRLPICSENKQCTDFE